MQPKPLEWVGTSKEVLARSVAFEKAVFVLHAFQKKSKHGAATPRKEIDLIRRRLAVADRAYTTMYENE